MSGITLFRVENKTGALGNEKIQWENIIKSIYECSACKGFGTIKKNKKTIICSWCMEKGFFSTIENDKN